jgi:hypothetical protein
MKLIVNVNAKEYSKSLKIMNIIFGSTIESIKRNNTI